MLTSYVTYTTVSNQIVVGDRRTTTSFLREEQKGAYAEFISADRTLQATEEFVRTIDLGPEPETPKLRTDLYAAWHKLHERYGALELVESPLIVQLGKYVVAAHGNCVTSIDAAADTEDIDRMIYLLSSREPIPEKHNSIRSPSANRFAYSQRLADDRRDRYRLF